MGAAVAGDAAQDAETPLRRPVTGRLGAAGHARAAARADPETLGLLFESLVVRDLRIYSQAEQGEVYCYRDNVGLEADAVVERHDGAWIAVDVKLSPSRRIGGPRRPLTVETAQQGRGTPRRRPGRAAGRNLRRRRLPPPRRRASGPDNRSRPLTTLQPADPREPVAQGRPTLRRGRATPSNTDRDRPKELRG